MSFALFIAALSFFIGQAKVIPEPIRIGPLLTLSLVAVLATMLCWLWRVRVRRTLQASSALAHQHLPRGTSDRSGTSGSGAHGGAGLYPSMSLTDAQRRVDAWVSQFEEGYFHPLTNLARLSEEVGELAREINHRYGQKTKKTEEPDGDVAMEMADILFVVICMANREGIDLQTAFDRMMDKVEQRDDARWTKKR
jgi:NTP pyrophosphatase (non-canonical NTP hydrolase)